MLILTTCSISRHGSVLKLLVHMIAVVCLPPFEIVDITFDSDFMINTIHFNIYW